MTTFSNWLDTFLSEKNIDQEKIMEINGRTGLNLIPVSALVDAMKRAPKREQAQIKNTLIVIDFKNGDVMHFLKHAAQAIAI